MIKIKNNHPFPCFGNRLKIAKTWKQQEKIY